MSEPRLTVWDLQHHSRTQKFYKKKLIYFNRKKTEELVKFLLIKRFIIKAHLQTSLENPPA